MKLEDTEKRQVIFKSNLNQLLKGRFKSKEKKSALENIKLLYESTQTTTELFNEYSSFVSEAKYRTRHGEGFKILTSKQILQRLPIALAQVKAGNTSEKLLNEITQVIYSLYQAKKIY